MHFDLKITMGDLLTAAAILVSAMGLFWRLSQFIGVFREYPPHRHINDEEVLYPKGMKPETVKHRRANA